MHNQHSVTRRDSLKRVLLPIVVAAVGLVAPAAYAVKQTGGEYNTMYAGLGAKGYDAVSYFTKGKPTMGSAQYENLYGGVTWRFVNQKNLDMFAANPQK